MDISPRSCPVTPVMNQIQKLGIPSVARVCVTQRKPGATEGRGWPETLPEGQGRSWPVAGTLPVGAAGVQRCQSEPSENVHSSSFQKLFLGPAGATEKGCLDMLEDSSLSKCLRAKQAPHPTRPQGQGS